jgi:isopenicillin N synthase-like dioxygenase
LFTILFQDAHGGLQFLDRSTGEFLDAVPKDGVLYMNIGDMFQRVSNGEFPPMGSLSLHADRCLGFYPSALHRVVAKDSNASRYSIPYFVAPTPDGVIVPQPSRIARDGEKRYEAITFRKFSEQMFKTIGVYS